MAGTIGVGSALRRARELRGITVEEACRDTRLSPAQVAALEAEAFDDLGGEVYARAMLRTYAQYLGLDAGKVVRVYARVADEPEGPPPPGKMGRVERAMAAARIRDNQRFLLIAAVVVLVALVAVGLVSRGGAAPEAAPIPTGDPSALGSLAASAPATDTTVDVVLTAGAEVEVSAVIDGVPQEAVTLRPGEIASYSGASEVEVSASDGGAISVMVNGRDYGSPGSVGEPWSDTYAFGAEDGT
jgi:transcriptional regulator with XRE-family HTH domain